MDKEVFLGDDYRFYPFLSPLEITDVNVSCLDHKPQSFYWDVIQLQPSYSATVICQ